MENDDPYYDNTTYNVVKSKGNRTITCNVILQNKQAMEVAMIQYT